MVATTLEKECIHGIGDADSSARGAKKPGESKRSTAEVREKRREGAGPSTSHGGQDQEQAAPIPEEATAEYPQSPLLFGSQDTGAAELSPTPTSPSPVLGRVRSHDVPPRRILQTSSEEEEVEGDTQDRGNTEQQPSPRVTRASVRGRRPREVEDVRQVQGVFCGLEATMVKVQRLQAKAMMGVQRHARTTNNKLEAKHLFVKLLFFQEIFNMAAQQDEDFSEHSSEEEFVSEDPVPKMKEALIWTFFRFLTEKKKEMQQR
ncbi:uncharacterized protein LOC144762737 [Lissotriton helveticus]